jgi:predicted MFS family arabinose efflux permease
MMGGTLLGDLIFRGDDLAASVETMFYCAAGLAATSAAFCWLATRGHEPPRRRRRAPLWAIVRRYHPGALLLVCVAVGIGSGIPQNFLRPYTTELGIADMMVYFWVYAPTAFAVRWSIRGLPERVGIRPMIVAGMGMLAVSMLLYLVVVDKWMLAVPAVVAGAAHAMLFPAAVGGGSTAFPARHRGLGVTLIFAMMDFGILIGSPLAGLVLEGARATGMAPYSVMFTAMAGLMAAACTYYLLMSHPRRNGRSVAGKFGEVTRPRMKRLPAAKVATGEWRVTSDE